MNLSPTDQRLQLRLLGAILAFSLSADMLTGDVAAAQAVIDAADAPTLALVELRRPKLDAPGIPDTPV